MKYTHFLNDEEKMKDFLILSKEEFLKSYSYLTEEEYDLTMDKYQVCPNCGKPFERGTGSWTYDCHGIRFRYVCDDCWYQIMDDENGKGYDGEYYTEADECLDWDY